ncbi:13896_t:CDS:1, partial [Gigaspora rosea]
MPKRKKFSKLYEYNKQRKKAAQEKRGIVDRLEEKDFEQSSEEDSDHEEDKGINEEKMTRRCLLTIPLAWNKKTEIRTVK